MQNTESKLSKHSKNLFWGLKSIMKHYNVNLKLLLFRLFNKHPQSLHKNEFRQIIRFGNIKVPFDQIDIVFKELKENDTVSVADIEKELKIVQNPYSTITNPDKQQQDESMIASLKEVKATMIKKNPNYIFDLYDINKDGYLDVEQLNNLLIGCCVSKPMDKDMRKTVLKRFLSKIPNNKINKNQLLDLFGLQHITTKNTLPTPSPTLQAHDDKQVANKYVMQSRIARKQDIINFQINLNINYNNQPNTYRQYNEPIKVKQHSLPKQTVIIPQEPSKKSIQPIRPISSQPRRTPPSIQSTKLTQKQLLPIKERSRQLTPPPIKRDQRDALRYYRLETKHTEMIDLLQFYLKNKETFVDSQAPRTNKGEYLHAKDIFKNPKYYLFHIVSSVLMREKDRQGLAQFLQPKDIIQGSLGDCYFLSSISSLVEYYPEILSELFLFDVNPSGLYIVRLFNDGQWSSVVLDDRFPCIHGKPIFARPHGNEIWVLLLEKAWAKLHGSYQQIDSGSSMEALIALTGAPCKVYHKEDDDIKKAIVDGFSSGSVVTCSGSDELNDLSKESAQTIGLIQRHAYSVQRMIEVVRDGKKQLLVKIRNPWGNQQWKGDWSFKNSKWDDKLRKQYNYINNPQDGSFYMSWESFEKYFGSVTVCKIVRQSISSSYRSKNLRHKSSYIRMTIAKKGIYTISIYQESKRKYQHSPNYGLSESRLIILQIDNIGNFKYIKSGTKQSSNLHLQTQLSPGEYMLSCKVVWNHFEEHECVVASYGPDNVKFRPYNDRSIAPKFKLHMIKSYAQQFPGDRHHYEKLNIPEAYREVVFNIEHGIGYIKINNPSKKSFSTTIVLNKSKGIKIIKPEVLPLKLSILPHTESLTGFLVSAKGYSYSLEENMKAAV